MTPRTTLLLATLTLVAGLAFADAATAADSDDAILQNDHVRVEFQDGKPLLLVLPATATDVTAGYTYHFLQLVEYNDVDADGAPSAGEVVASLDLADAEWRMEREAGEGNDSLSLSVLAPVRLGPGVATPLDDLALPAGERLANVTLVFRVHHGATTLGAEETTIDVPASALTHELLVTSWPFVNADVNRLALTIDVGGALEMGETNATVLANETPVGEIGWLPTATGATAAGEAREVAVRATAANASERAFTRLSITYDAPGLASLSHQAATGVPPTPDALVPLETASEPGLRSEVPGAGPVLAALAVAASAFVLRRR